METQISGPVAVIGDVHGQVDQLSSLISQLRELPDYDQRWIVFIGDLVDRGPDPKGAIDLVLELMTEHPRTTAIAGNHELAMAGALGLNPTPRYIDWAARWLDHYGAGETFASYNVPTGDLVALREELPVSHAEYLRNVPWCVEHSDFFFVHSGLDPNTPFELQRDILRSRDFSLQRPEWLCSKTLPFQQPPDGCRQTVVSGHVRVPHVTFDQRRILIDTSGGRGGDMSCVLLPELDILKAGSGSRGMLAGARKKGWLW